MQCGSTPSPYVLCRLIVEHHRPSRSRKDTADEFQWRVRNLPYPVDTYQITIDDATQEIVIRTTNKKYSSPFFCTPIFYLFHMKLLASVRFFLKNV
jgi:hypothetical protein